MGDTKNLSEDNGADKFNLGSGEANQATTSKLSVNPEENSHNMNDLKALDFNSADEVRQTMKAVLSCKEPYNTAEENISQRIVGNVEKKVNNDKKPVEVEIANKEQINNLIKTEPKENICVLVNPKTEIWSSNDCNVKKRPGRPPKAGTSKKKVKKASVTTLYLGKLSNVVPFKRRRIYRSESESDESLIIFY